MAEDVLLVADDDVNDALFLERALQRAGSAFRMVHVATGDELIDYIQGKGAFADRGLHPAPKIVLLDLKMPRTDGFSVLRWRKECPEGYRVPVVVFSSSSLEQDIACAYSLGASSYVVKPTAPDRLGAMVQALNEWWGVFNKTADCSPA
jgi:CheY-like chemotaxis protein